MALRATPTIAICLTAGIAAGVALARPGDTPDTAAAPVAQPVTTAPAPPVEPDSPYLADDAAAAPVVGAADADAEPAAPIEISIEGFTFSPTESVLAGSPIAVTNLDGADHTLTATGGEFDTGALGQGQSATFIAPTSPGTYAFFCEIHPSMTGQLVVS